MNNKTNIICLKVGSKYNSSYVNNLYYMIKKNSNLDINLTCFTDDKSGIDKKIESIKLPLFNNNKIYGWFYKLALFDPKINPLRGNILYFDLDIVINSNIDDMINYNSEKLVIIEDWIYKKNNIKKYNSSVIKWNILKYTNLFNDFLNNNRKKYVGDQDFITDYVRDAEYWPENWCISYKWSECENKNNIPENCKILVFHGKPKPHELKNSKIIKEKTIF